jgi:hypothetical protein
MDWLTKNHCKMDFIARTVQCENHMLYFLNENDMQKYKHLVENGMENFVPEIMETGGNLNNGDMFYDFGVGKDDTVIFNDFGFCGNM